MPTNIITIYDANFIYGDYVGGSSEIGWGCMADALPLTIPHEVSKNTTVGMK